MERHRVPSSQALTILKPMELQRKAAKPRRKASERADTLRGTEGPAFKALLSPSRTSLSGRGSPGPSCSFRRLRSIQVCSRAKAAVDSLSALEGGQGAEGAATVAIAE